MAWFCSSQSKQLPPDAAQIQQKGFSSRPWKLICDSARRVWCVGKIRRAPKHPKVSISSDNRAQQTKNRGEPLDQLLFQPNKKRLDRLGEGDAAHLYG